MFLFWGGGNLHKAFPSWAVIFPPRGPWGILINYPVIWGKKQLLRIIIISNYKDPEKPTSIMECCSVCFPLKVPMEGKHPHQWSGGGGGMTNGWCFSWMKSWQKMGKSCVKNAAFYRSLALILVELWTFNIGVDANVVFCWFSSSSRCTVYRMYLSLTWKSTNSVHMLTIANSL